MEGFHQVRLFVVILRGDLLQIFRFEDLAAVETLDVIDAIAAGNDFRPWMCASEFHRPD